MASSTTNTNNNVFDIELARISRDLSSKRFVTNESILHDMENKISDLVLNASRLLNLPCIPKEINPENPKALTKADLEKIDYSLLNVEDELSEVIDFIKATKRRAEQRYKESKRQLRRKNDQV
jgi:hypothetical protein